MWSRSRLGILVGFSSLWSVVFLVEATSPGLNLRLSQPGLDYAASVAVDILSARVRQMSIPDQHGSADIAVGEVSYDVTNIQVGL